MQEDLRSGTYHQQMLSHHPQARQGEQRHPLSPVLRQTAKVHLDLTEQALDHPDSTPYLRLDLLDPAFDSAQGAALAMLPVGAAASRARHR